MAALTTIALVAGATAALAGTGLAVDQKLQSDRQGRIADRQRDQLLKEAKDREAQEAASKKAAEARRRQVAATSSNYGRASTILTGPQGLGGGQEALG